MFDQEMKIRGFLMMFIYSWLKANKSLWLVVKGHGPDASLVFV